MKKFVYVLIGALLFAVMGCGGSGTTTSGIQGEGAPETGPAVAEALPPAPWGT